ncbi:MAG: hypothetical protein RL071_535, partial [Pseudomonadota bacterium]
PGAAAALRAEARRRGGSGAPDADLDGAPAGDAGDGDLDDADDGVVVGAAGPPDPAAVAATTAALRRFVLGVALAGLGPVLAAGLAAVLPGSQAGLAGGALSGLLLVAPVAGQGPRARWVIGGAVALGGLLGAIAGARQLG